MIVFAVQCNDWEGTFTISLWLTRELAEAAAAKHNEARDKRYNYPTYDVDEMEVHEVLPPELMP